jgi:hypothetical protein
MMIADDLIILAIGVFVLLIIGLSLTVLEFRYGEPKQQQENAERDADSARGG